MKRREDSREEGQAEEFEYWNQECFKLEQTKTVFNHAYGDYLFGCGLMERFDNTIIPTKSNRPILLFPDSDILFIDRRLCFHPRNLKWFGYNP